MDDRQACTCSYKVVCLIRNFLIRDDDHMEKALFPMYAIELLFFFFLIALFSLQTNIHEQLSLVVQSCLYYCFRASHYGKGPWCLFSFEIMITRKTLFPLFPIYQNELSAKLPLILHCSLPNSGKNGVVNTMNVVVNLQSLAESSCIWIIRGIVPVTVIYLKVWNTTEQQFLGVWRMRNFSLEEELPHSCGLE